MQFNFSSSEKKGLIALIVIIMVLQISIFIVSRQLNSESTISLSDQEHEAFQKQLDSIAALNHSEEFPKPDYSKIDFFEFNPNTVSHSNLLKLGLSGSVANTFISYREKVKPFQTKMDLFKIYGIDSSLVVLLLPYVQIHQLETKQKKQLPISKEPEKVDSLFEFNPNTISLAELRKLSFSEKLANTFINYRDAIGGFKSINQIKNIYGLSNDFFDQLSPYILLPELEKEEAKLIVEINAATATDLILLDGIGEVLSNRIVKYRNYLGGFYSIEQLRRVYGLSETTFEQIKMSLTVDTTLIEAININFAGISELKKLPACNEKIAEQIIENRSKNGAFRNIDQLKLILNEKEFDILKYYLTVK